MHIQVDAKDFDLHEAQHFIINKGLRRIVRLCKHFPEDTISAHVKIDYHRPPKLFTVHLTVSLPHDTVSTTTDNYRFPLAFSQALKKITTQLRKSKNKLSHQNDYAKISQAKGKA
jgi:ribosomal subunit interface protein